jgi:hypothetical protein
MATERFMDLDFRRTKFVYGGLVFGLNQFSLLPQLPQKNNPQFKSGLN